MELLIVMGLAIAPGIALSVYIYFRDKYDKEPLTALIISFLLGVLSAVPALIAEIMLEKIPAIGDRTFMRAFLGIALPEEMAKMFFILIYAYRKKVFNEPYDGITYSVMVSMGFATIENIFYVWEGGWIVALLRIFTAVPAHATFAILMGYYLGLSKFSSTSRIPLLLMGLFSAVMFHGAYDFFLMVENIPGIWLGAFVSLGVGLFLSLRATRIHNKNSPFGVSQNTEMLK